MLYKLYLNKFFKPKEVRITGLNECGREIKQGEAWKYTISFVKQ